MRYLLLISLLSLTFTQELKVEGNLNVTGNIQNDSLLQVIQDLQNQITILQSSGNWESRLFNYTFTNLSLQNSDTLSLYELTGYELDFGLIKLIKIQNIDFTTESNGNTHLNFKSVNINSEFQTTETIGNVEYVINHDTFKLTMMDGFLNSEIMLITEIGEINSIFNSIETTFLITSNFTTESSTQQSQTTSKQSK